MKTRPILFSAPMVRALLAGTKTQTRRIINPQPTHFNPAGVPRSAVPAGGSSDVIRCKYGSVGDHLYVRETWAAPHAYDHLPPRLIPQDARIHYAATEDRGGLLWRPSIHMPRQASRITLEITGVRVERLQDISEADAIAEGLERTSRGHWLPGPCDHPEWAYHLLWDQINGAGAWAANPWVWVLEFRRVEADA